MQAKHNRIKSALLGITLTVATAGPALAADPTSVTADVLLARPIGFVGTVVGTGAFIATAPFTFAAGTHRESARVLVSEPLNYTFRRPLGENL